MNVIDAARAAAEQGLKIFNEERKEWIEFSSGSFRYVSNRSEVKFTLKDLTSEVWVSENDFLVSTKPRIERALQQYLENVSLDKTQEELNESFFKAIAVENGKTKEVLGWNGVLP